MPLRSLLCPIVPVNMVVSFADSWLVTILPVTKEGKSSIVIVTGRANYLSSNT